MDVENNESRRLIFIIMTQILTPEEKKYLNRTCNLIGSYGMDIGSIGIELEYDTNYLDESIINWEYVTHFENNYRVEIPEGLIPILKKVMNYIIDEGVFESPDIEDMNYQRIDIQIDCPRKEITVTHDYSYYGRGDGSSIEYDSDEDKERFDKWMVEDMQDVEVPNDGILTVTYNGSGDSGYIESSFDETNDAIPASIEDWMYRQLERNFGGWEINEGSDGRIIFNFNNSTVEIDHTYNTMENESTTLFEENFAL
jgi:hypothetical protein